MGRTHTTVDGFRLELFSTLYGSHDTWNTITQKEG